MSLDDIGSRMSQMARLSHCLVPLLGGNQAMIWDKQQKGCCEARVWEACLPMGGIVERTYMLKKLRLFFFQTHSPHCLLPVFYLPSRAREKWNKTSPFEAWGEGTLWSDDLGGRKEGFWPTDYVQGSRSKVITRPRKKSLVRVSFRVTCGPIFLKFAKSSKKKLIYL